MDAYPPGVPPASVFSKRTSIAPAEARVRLGGGARRRARGRNCPGPDRHRAPLQQQRLHGSTHTGGCAGGCAGGQRGAAGGGALGRTRGAREGDPGREATPSVERAGGPRQAPRSRTTARRARAPAAAAAATGALLGELSPPVPLALRWSARQILRTPLLHSCIILDTNSVRARQERRCRE